MKQLLAFLCFAALVGCNNSDSESDAGKNGGRVITEKKARQIASEHANLFLKDKTYKHPDGTKHPFPSPFTQPSTWHSVTKTTNGWVLRCDPPKGPYVYVKMDLLGENVEVTNFGFSPD